MMLNSDRCFITRTRGGAAHCANGSTVYISIGNSNFLHDVKQNSPADQSESRHDLLCN